MKRYEALYQILCDSKDLLQGDASGVHQPFAGRVEGLMTVMDAEDRPGRSDRSGLRGDTVSSAAGATATDERERVATAAVATGAVATAAVATAAVATGALSPVAAHPFAPYETLDVERRRDRLRIISAGITGCARCPLSMGRTLSVAGEGVLDPLVMFVGEGPGRDEDESGRPFVGAAGQFLDKWLLAIGLNRDTNAFITNIVKCRPPNNRDPQPEETDACTPWLLEQIALVRPRMIVTLGRISTRVLTGSTQGITRIHGTFFSWRGIPLVPTFHPSAVLRRDEWRRPVWEDLKTIRNWLVDNAGHVPPENSPD